MTFAPSKLVTEDVILSAFLHNCVRHLRSLKISAAFPITLRWNAVARLYIKLNRKYSVQYFILIHSVSKYIFYIDIFIFIDIYISVSFLS